MTLPYNRLSLLLFPCFILEMLIHIYYNLVLVYVSNLYHASVVRLGCCDPFSSLPGMFILSHIFIKTSLTQLLLHNIFRVRICCKAMIVHLFMKYWVTTLRTTGIPFINIFFNANISTPSEISALGSSLIASCEQRKQWCQRICIYKAHSHCSSCKNSAANRRSTRLSQWESTQWSTDNVDSPDTDTLIMWTDRSSSDSCCTKVHIMCPLKTEIRDQNI